MHSGILGGVVGSVVGVAGGLFGTYCSIKNTHGPKERQFVVKACIITWIAVVLFVALVLVLPHPYRWFMWVPYAILLPLGIVRWNKRQAQIRTQELESPNKQNA